MNYKILTLCTLHQCSVLCGYILFLDNFQVINKLALE
jgi:hypothetical protein